MRNAYKCRYKNFCMSQNKYTYSLHMHVYMFQNKTICNFPHKKNNNRLNIRICIPFLFRWL